MALKNGNTIQLAGREAKLSQERLEQISHDFRTSLNIIIGFTDLLLDEIPGKINDEQRRSLNDILSSGHRLLGLVNKVFDSSSPDSNIVLNS